MEEEKKVGENNSKKIICICAVVIIVLGTIGVLFATGVLNFKESGKSEIHEPSNQDNTEEIINQNDSDDLDDNDSLAPWMNYLLKQNITSIKLIRTDVDNNSRTADLTKDNLKTVFGKIMNYQIVKNYTLGSGFTFGDDLTISYTLNGVNYHVSILEGDIYDQYNNNGDSGLINAFESSNYVIENENLKNQEGASYYYLIKNYDSSILDEFLI